MEQIDYTKKLFHFQCKRKHLLIDQVYFTYVFSDMIIMGKKHFDPKPKYTIQLNLKQIIHWTIKLGQLSAFGIQTKKDFKWFDSNHNDLIIFQDIIRNKVMFCKFSDFYKPIQLIGSGVSSQVYLIQHPLTLNEFATKCIPKSFFAEKQKNSDNTFWENSYDMFYNEVTILKKLKHPGIIEMIEIYEGSSTFYIIFEFLKGQTLNRVLKTMNRPPSVDLIRTIMKSLLEALEYIHNLNIIHRDIKPDNLMFKFVDKFDSLKIIDFGFATLANLQKFTYPKCGSPGYVAPEIVNLPGGQYTYSNKCDIFSAGVILYKMFTLQNLFPGHNTEAILRMNQKCRINLSLLKVFKVPKTAEDLIVKMLTINPERRISASEALKHPFILNQVENRILQQDFFREQSLNLSQISKDQQQKDMFDDFDISDIKENKPQLIPPSIKLNVNLKKVGGYLSFIMKRNNQSLKIDNSMKFSQVYSLEKNFLQYPQVKNNNQSVDTSKKKCCYFVQKYQTEFFHPGQQIVENINS